MPKIGVAVNSWVLKNITIVQRDLTTARVFAKVNGPLAVHEAIAPDTGWVITHVPTGRTLSSVGTEADAYKIAEFAWNKCAKIFSEKTYAGVLSRTPRWLAEWCISCRKANKYLPPQEVK